MKLEINVPSSISEIPLKSYQEFLRVQADSNDEEFVAQKMIEIFCNVELKYVSQFKRKQIVEIVTTINKLFEKIPPFKNRFSLISNFNKFIF
jgi:hypothetical protein